MLEWNLKIYLDSLNQGSDYLKQHCVGIKCKLVILLFCY